jgi:probable F420-dependent oxidoreductase
MASSGPDGPWPAPRDGGGSAVKVRIGVGTGAAALDGAALATLAEDLGDLGFDSLWLAEVLTAPAIDPLVGLAWAGAHQPRLKLGTTMLLPGRNPVMLAKQVASLDRLSAGRFLVTFVPGLARGAEREALGVAVAERGRAIDELLPLLRRLWAGERVTYEGPAGRLADVAISLLPVQDPFEVWLGGMARPSLERCGRLADGWLPAMCSPAEAKSGRAVVEQAAADAGRAISPEHFGVSIGYAWDPIDGRLEAALTERARGRPLAGMVPVGAAALRELLEHFVAVGFSKFVVRPLEPPAAWRRELEQLAAAVGDLQT